MTRQVVQCDGARIPAEWASHARDLPPLQVNRYGHTPQVTLRLQEMSDPIAGTLTGKAYDLVSIAAYVYVADQLLSRGGETDVYGDNWRHNMMACVPVGEPTFWNDAKVRSLLEETVSYVSGETWQFAFSASMKVEQLPLQGIDERSIRYDPNCVILLSGGADSLCATVEAVLEKGLRPVLVSHRSVPSMQKTQWEVVDLLRTKVKEWAFPHSKFIVNKVKTREKDTTQRTRSFLFATLGAAVASSIGVDSVMLADNGIVSLNLPINGQLVGSLASRSTHPKFIALFNKLANAVLPNRPQVVNPLRNRTKAEVLEILKRHRLSDLLQATNSCAHRRNLERDVTHCGGCSQCVDRRLASVIAGMEAFDPKRKYTKDIFRDAFEGKALTMVESCLRFVKKVHGLSPEQIYLEYPQIAEAILSDDVSPDTTVRRYISMVQRYADSVIQAVSQQVSAASEELVLESLPPTCLIRLSVAGSTKRSDEIRPVHSVLSREAQQECIDYGFNSQLPVLITGQVVGRKSNLLYFGENKVNLPDAEFRLLLRLIVALYETDDGFVDRGSMRNGGGLVDEGVYHADSIDQAANRLRFRIGPALSGLDAKDYVEVQRKRIRLSTHRSCIEAHRDLLLRHPNKEIPLLAARLPVGGLGPGA